MESAEKEGEGRDWNKGRTGRGRRGGQLRGKGVKKGGKEREGGEGRHRNKGGRGQGKRHGVERGGKEEEGRDGNKERGGKGWGTLRGKGVKRGGEEGKRRKNGDVSRLRPSSYSLLCVQESNQMKFKHIDTHTLYLTQKKNFKRCNSFDGNWPFRSSALSFPGARRP